LFVVYNELRKVFDQTPYIRFLNALTGSPLLVIDDVDKKTPRDWDWDVYWMIFEVRYVARRPTILSANKRAELARSLGISADSSRWKCVVTICAVRRRVGQTGLNSLVVETIKAFPCYIHVKGFVMIRSS
jgi:hypothetical protein